MAPSKSPQFQARRKLEGEGIGWQLIMRYLGKGR
jgi:hypothetical protein